MFYNRIPKNILVINNMKIVKKFFLTLLSIIFCLNITLAQNQDQKSTNAKVDSYVKTIMQRHKIPGVALAIIQNGKVTHKTYYGNASLVHNVPVTKKTIFRIYSTTKLFVATGIFKLIEEGKLSLEDEVTKYVDGLPKTWQKLKVKHLITHSSGLPDMAPFWKFQNLSEEQAKEVVFSEPIKSQPGEEYSYNQTNFWLLQKIIEKTSRQKFTDFILTHQFGKKNNNAFFNADSRDIIPNRTLPYFPFAKNRIQIDASYSGDYLMSANGFNITLDEFIKWNRRFDNNDFLKKETKNLMWTPFTYKKPRKFAYSWGMYPLNDRVSYGFTGGLVTGFRKIPKDKLDIIFLTNGFDRFFRVDDVIDYVAGIVDKDLHSNALITIEEMRAEFLEGDVKTALKNFAKWRAVIPDVNLEDFLNTQGYNALRNGKVADAIEIFKINTEEYPKSGNVWDSLGEAYLANKQYKLALEKYKQSLELDPTSENGKTMIKKIEEILKNQ